MGYSIYARFKTKNEVERMWKFLELHFRDITKLFPGRQDYPFARLARNDGPDAKMDGLSYCRHKYAIGFDCNTCLIERRYIHMMVCWMAHRSSVRKVWNKRKWPVFVYDGQESWIVVTDQDVQRYGQENLPGYIRADWDGFNFPTGDNVRELIYEFADWSKTKATQLAEGPCGLEIPEEVVTDALSRARTDFDVLQTELKWLSRLWEETGHG
jgi:hypothetical protein